MKHFYFWIVLLGCTFSAFAAEIPLTPYDQLIPAKAASLEEFSPKGFTIIQSIRGPLFSDSSNDCAMIVQDMRAPVSDGDNGTDVYLVIVKRESTGFALFLISEKLPCSQCGGIAGGEVISLKNRVLTVSVYSGSREAREERYRYRFDAGANEFLLIGGDIREWDKLTGKTSFSSSINYLNGIQIIDGRKSKIDISKKEYLN